VLSSFAYLVQRLKAVNLSLIESVDGEDPDEACSIKVVIGWRYIIGDIKHDEYGQAKYKDALAKKVYEDSKTAVMGVHAV
jgi:hypothetical protein